MMPRAALGLWAALLVLSLATLAARADPAEYATPEAAADAVVAALEARDRDALLAVFGPEAEDLVFTGSKEQDREIWTEFLLAYRDLHRVAIDESGETATLYLGQDQWPFPAPIVRHADGLWAFDPEAARDEIILRRIGRNELDVIDLMGAYVDLQSRYRQVDHNGDGVMEFARTIISSEGKRDGLYWDSEPGEPESPIGDFVARASADGYSIDGEDSEPDPYLGYYYRILKQQGPAGPGSTMSYLVNDKMVAGHALLAFPADYGETGIMTFVVGENGVVYEKDLGDDTVELADAIDSYDPDASWSLAE